MLFHGTTSGSVMLKADVGSDMLLKLCPTIDPVPTFNIESNVLLELYPILEPTAKFSVGSGILLGCGPH